MSKLLYGTNDRITGHLFDWFAAQLPYGLTGNDLRPGYAIGCMEGDELVAVVIFNQLRRDSAEIGIVSTSPKWLTRQVCTHIASFAFDILNLRRLTGITPKKNKRARELALRLGFVYEATLKEGYANGEDATVYRMLRRECKWLKTPNADQPNTGVPLHA